MDSLIKIVNLEASKYQDITNILKKLVEKRYIERLVNLYQEIFISEQ